MKEPIFKPWILCLSPRTGLLKHGHILEFVIFRLEKVMAISKILKHIFPSYAHKCSLLYKIICNNPYVLIMNNLEKVMKVHRSRGVGTLLAGHTIVFSICDSKC